jgi:hypothetical protein
MPKTSNKNIIIVIIPIPAGNENPKISRNENFPIREERKLTPRKNAIIIPK